MVKEFLSHVEGKLAKKEVTNFSSESAWRIDTQDLPQKQEAIPQHPIITLMRELKYVILTVVATIILLRCTFNVTTARCHFARFFFFFLMDVLTLDSSDRRRKYVKAVEVKQKESNLPDLSFLKIEDSFFSDADFTEPEPTTELKPVTPFFELQEQEISELHIILGVRRIPGNCKLTSFSV